MPDYHEFIVDCSKVLLFTQFHGVSLMYVIANDLASLKVVASKLVPKSGW